MNSIDENDKKILLFLIIGSFVVIFIISLFVSFSPAPKDVDTSFLENSSYETCIDLIPCTKYTLETEQTIEEIAEKYVTTTDTIISANPDIITNEDGFMAIGTELKIPDRVGIYYVVSEGETFQTILEKHGVELNDESTSEILRINGISEENIKPGIRIFLPEGKYIQM